MKLFLRSEAGTLSSSLSGNERHLSAALVSIALMIFFFFFTFDHVRVYGISLNLPRQSYTKPCKQPSAPSPFSDNQTITSPLGKTAVRIKYLLSALFFCQSRSIYAVSATCWALWWVVGGDTRLA